MNIHKNARTTPYSRLLMARRVGAGDRVVDVAADFCVSEQTVGKWVRRWQSGGEAALLDRSSRPTRVRSTSARRIAEIERLRRQRLSSPAIARQLNMANSTVTKVLRRLGLNRLTALDPPAPVVRYQRQRPGELLHLDTKKLGRIAGIGHRITGRRTGAINRHHGIGWECLHVCIDDACRLAYNEVLPDERKETATAFLERALAWFARHGVVVERVMTDNGNCYRSDMFRQACALPWPAPSANPAVHPAHQWQGRTLHPDQLARVGLCKALCQLAAAQRGIDHLARPVQYRSATHRLGQLSTGNAIASISVAWFDRRGRCFVPICVPR